MSEGGYHSHAPRAPYATHSADSRGRLYEEPASHTRTPFQRDRDRIIHAQAFRRLAYKTQVFVNHEGDFFRTRLTHSLEVSQIARSVCRYLGTDEDLGEALALAHDLGHPPFGHAGEDALREAMEDYGGFDHNAQSLLTVTSLERRYPAFDGLNLTWETLEGIAKHNGPLIEVGNGKHTPLARGFSQYAQCHDLEYHTHAGLEAQIAAQSDDIAYDNHDTEDGLNAGLFAIEDLRDVPIAGPAFHAVRKEFPDIPRERLIAEAVRRMIGVMVDDLLVETQSRLAALAPQSAAEVRLAQQPMAGFSDTMRQDQAMLKKFLFDHMYRHYQLNRMTSKARRIVRDLFDLFLHEPECLPAPWCIPAFGASGYTPAFGASGYIRTEGAKQEDPTHHKAVVICNYIAGMTDRLAQDEYRRLFDMQSRIS